MTLRPDLRPEAIVRALPTLLLLLFLVLGGWLAARWVWYFASPAERPTPQVRSPVQLGAAAQTVADAHLFGVVTTADPGVQVVSNLNIKLKGVFASNNDAPAFAIVNSGGTDETARAGREIAPGVVLESIHPEHVVLRRNGALERINLEERPALAAGAIGTGGPRVSAPPRAVAQRPAAAPSTVFVRPEPYAPVGEDATAQPPAVANAPPPPPNPAQAAPTPQTQASPSGLVIRSVPTGTLFERYGLQPGDVIRSVNGVQVTSEADIARVMRERGAGTYTVEVVRGGLTIPVVIAGTR